MNKIIKSNIYYFCLISFAMCIYWLNIFIYELYWYEKLDRSFGKLDYLKDKVFDKGIPIDFSDYSSYGSNLNTIITSFFVSNEALILFFFMSIVATMYIIIPLFFIYFNLASYKMCIILDIIWGVLYIYLYMYIPIESPLYGFIPMCILAPMLFFMLVWFRIRQYKNIYGKEKVQKNE